MVEAKWTPSGFALMQENVKITLKVIPGSKKNQWCEENGFVKVYLAAPAVDGKANAALIKFTADHFDIKQRQIEIIRGLKSRHKVINICGL